MTTKTETFETALLYVVTGEKFTLNGEEYTVTSEFASDRIDAVDSNGKAVNLDGWEVVTVTQEVQD